jgi:hypothetical protein
MLYLAPEPLTTTGSMEAGIAAALQRLCLFASTKNLINPSAETGASPQIDPLIGDLHS